MDLGNGCVVHGLGVRQVARVGALHRAVGVDAQPACFDLAEVHVVDGGETTQQFALRARQRAHHRAGDVMRGVGLQTVQSVHLGAVVSNDQVVGDSGDVHLVPA